MSRAPRVNRNRPTKVIYLGLGVFGWMLYALGPSLDLLRIDQGSTALVMSLHFSLMQTGSIVGGFIVPHVTPRLGRGRTMRYAGFLLAAALVGISLGQNSFATLTAMFFLGIGATHYVALVSSFIEQEHGENSPVAMAEANVFSAVAGLFSPLVIGGAVALGWGWRIGLLTAAAVLVIAEYWRGDLSHYDGPESGAAATSASLSRTYWWAWLLLITTAGVEFTIVLWNTSLLRDRAGLGDAAAAAGLATFTGGIAVGRLLVSLLAQRFDNERLLQASFVLPLIAFWGFWASTAPVVMLFSLFLCGIGVGAHWPLGIGRLIRAGADHPDIAAARSAFATGGAGIVLPLLLGSLAGSIGVHSAFLMVPVVLVVGLGLLLFAPRPPAAGS